MTFRMHATGYGTDEDAGLLLARVEAARVGGDDDPGAMDDFCRRLAGFTSRSWRPGAERDCTPLPGRYRAARMRDRREGRVLAAVYRLGADDATVHHGAGFTVVGEQPTVYRLAAAVTFLALEEVVAWRATRQLPDVDPGVLELEVDVDLEPRSMLPDGTYLPSDLVRALSLKLDEWKAR